MNIMSDERNSDEGDICSRAAVSGVGDCDARQ